MPSEVRTCFSVKTPETYQELELPERSLEWTDEQVRALGQLVKLAERHHTHVRRHSRASLNERNWLFTEAIADGHNEARSTTARMERQRH
jgi:hypothetical protein